RPRLRARRHGHRRRGGRDARVGAGGGARARADAGDRSPAPPAGDDRRHRRDGGGPPPAGGVTPRSPPPPPAGTWWGPPAVRAAGVAARGGGKVVKNVAGFDLPKVACGSLGTLGMIATATFRLHPLPEATATALVPRLTADEVVRTIAATRQAQLEPCAAAA